MWTRINILNNYCWFLAVSYLKIFYYCFIYCEVKTIVFDIHFNQLLNLMRYILRGLDWNILYNRKILAPTFLYRH